MNIRPEEISNVIKEQIKNYQSKIEMKETGTVILVGDGIARVYGLRDCMASELLEFEDGSFGLAQNLESETVSVALLSSNNNIREGSTVKRTGRVLSVPVGEALLGRVVNALGESVHSEVIFTARKDLQPVDLPLLAEFPMVGNGDGIVARVFVDLGALLGGL